MSEQNQKRIPIHIHFMKAEDIQFVFIKGKGDPNSYSVFVKLKNHKAVNAMNDVSLRIAKKYAETYVWASDVEYIRIKDDALKTVKTYKNTMGETK